LLKSFILKLMKIIFSKNTAILIHIKSLRNSAFSKSMMYRAMSLLRISPKELFKIEKSTRQSLRKRRLLKINTTSKTKSIFQSSD
jgi:hypothetical protein